MRIRIVILLFILSLSQFAHAQDTVVNQVLAATNQTRIDRGISPLSYNVQLAQAAQRHSNDMAQTGILSHTGSDGSQFWQRIQAAGYTLTTGAENVLSRSDNNGADAFIQWFNSASHQANLLNPDYLEVGIAYAQASDGRYYFTMVLASRANITPQPIPPTSTARPTSTTVPTLAPTNTAIPTIEPSSTPLPTNTPVPPSPTRIPTDTVLATIIAPLPTVAIQSTPATFSGFSATVTPMPTATMPPPPDIRLIYDQNSFTLINISGRVLNLSNLIFESSSGSLLAEQWENGFLSQSLTGFTDGDCLQVFDISAGESAKPVSCDVRHSWIMTGDSGIFWRDADTFTVRNGTRLIGSCDTRDSICDVSFSAEITTASDTNSAITTADIRLIYNFDTLTLVNVSGRTLNIRGLRFKSPSGSMLVERWDNEFLTQPLELFRAGDCLQVWGLGVSNLLPAPSVCEVRHAWMAVGEEFDFWRGTDFFTVERDSIRLASCDIASGSCDVNLSANLGTVEQNQTVTQAQQQAPVIQGSNDMQIILDGVGFTLINTSGRELDLTGLAFESDTGVFVASRWNIADLSRPLNTFPAGDCLQVWTVGTEYQAPPNGCRNRHAWVAVADDAQFWTAPRVYRVRQANNFLQTCETRSTVCNFDLP